MVLTFGQNYFNLHHKSCIVTPLTIMYSGCVENLLSQMLCSLVFLNVLNWGSNFFLQLALPVVLHRNPRNNELAFGLLKKSIFKLYYAKMRHHKNLAIELVRGLKTVTDPHHDTESIECRPFYGS